MTNPAARSLLAGGIIAGIVGAVVFHAFLFLVGLAHYPAIYLWIASAVYPGHFDGTAIAVGVLLHFMVAIVAAVTYAYAATMVGLIGRPWLSGVLFGIVTNVLMDIIVYSRHLGPLPSSWSDVGMGLLAHVAFFAIPVSLMLSRYERVPLPWV